MGGSCGVGRHREKAPLGELGQDSGGRKEGYRQAVACWTWRVAAQPGVCHTSWDMSVTTSFLHRHPHLQPGPLLTRLGNSWLHIRSPLSSLAALL